MSGSQGVFNGFLRSGLQVLALVMSLCTVTRAQDLAEAEGPWTVEAVEAQLAELADDAPLAVELSDDERAELRDLWAQVLGQLHETTEFENRQASWDAARLAAPEKILALQAADGSEVPSEVPEVSAEHSLPELETGLAAAGSAYSELSLAWDEIQAEQARRAERRREVPDRLAELQQALVAVDEPTPAEDLPPRFVEAQDALRQATRLAQRAEFDALSAERPFFDAEEVLISMSLDEATRQRDDASAAVVAWETALSDARQRASALAQAQARQASEDVVDQPALVRELAAQSEAHAVRRNELTELHAQATAMLEQLVRAQGQMDELERASAEKIKVAGFSNSVAVLLRKQRGELPEILAVLDQRLDLPHSSIELELELIDRRRDRVHLGQHRDDQVQDVLKALDQAALVDGAQALNPSERAQLETVVRGLLQAQHAGLFPLITELNRYSDDLNAVEFASERLAASVSDYGRFIDEHILWVRSAAPLALSDLGLAARGFGVLLSPSTWAAASVALGIEVERRLVSVSWAGLALALLALLRPLSRRQIRTAGERLATRRMAPIGPTLVVTLLTLVRASFWPVLVWVAGWILSWPLGMPVVSAVGTGLMRLAPVLVPMLLLGEVCRPMGLAEAHLRWSNEVIRAVRRHLWLWHAFVVPAMGLTLVFDAPGLAEFDAAAGRLALMVALVGLTVVAHRFTRSEGAVMRALRRDTSARFLGRMQWIWFPITGLLPAALVVAVALGFQYGSMQVGLGLVHSVTLALPLLILRGVVRRWLSLARLRLALEQLQRRREAEAEAQEAASDPEVSGEIRAMAEEQPELDVGQIDEQAMRLVDVSLLAALFMGLMLIWSDLLPALGGLRRVELWQSLVTTSLPDGTATTQIVLVSLADALGALVVVGLTVLATRNIAGLLEMTVLRRLTLEPGGGYAITTVCRYMLTAGGVIGAASLLGITWDSVQWLAAAVSVGLGFGLQEIFANFVSGLIILFERPIRVGDIITVGGIEGVVTRIRTRATTIRDRDRRELLVPNKEFITGQLVNWTLSDPISRLILPVGIAYGSDTELAQQTLIEVAVAHALVLEAPAPSVVFRNFGDSTLDYELRVFIPDRDFWPNVTHDLNTSIHEAFAEKGLEIAFPQRDLHLRDGVGEVLGDWVAAKTARGLGDGGGAASAGV